jgi:APA family basic amino acid/polyamine antiporter
MTVTSLALVFSFWALAGTGYQAIYYGIFAFFLGIPVYIWMKAQRGEYGESPVVPIEYPHGSPYAVKAGNGNGHATDAGVAAWSSDAVATHAEVLS